MKVVPPQDEVADLVQEFLNETNSSESSLTPRKPSPRKQPSKHTSFGGATDHVDAGINLEAGVSDISIRCNLKIKNFSHRF